MFNDWRDNHYEMIVRFLGYLNNTSNNFILKGGTSLMLCYSLDRFSEDVDLDAINKKYNIINIVDTFCKINNTEYRIAKNTDTVKRCMIHYGGNKPLKIEVSYRRTNIDNNEYGYINNILTYNIQNMAIFKLNAYLGRDKIRDLYDIVFICKNYVQFLPDMIITQFKYAIAQKGLEYFDYIIATQKDDLIDNEKLAFDFLELYYNLGFK